MEMEKIMRDKEGRLVLAMVAAPRRAPQQHEGNGYGY